MKQAAIAKVRAEAGVPVIGVLETVFDDAATERDAALEAAFVDAIGHDKYQRLLDEQWLPFEGAAHLALPLADAVAREVKDATEFLQSLDDGATSIAAPAIKTETWIAWLDGRRDEAVTFEVQLAGAFDVAEAGATALGVDVSENLNVQRASTTPRLKPGA